MVSPGAPQDRSWPWRDVTGSRGGRGRSSQGLRAPHERHLPSLHGSLLFTEQQLKDSARIAGVLSGSRGGLSFAGRSRDFSGKNDASTAEEGRKILLVRAGIFLWGMHGEMVSPRMPQQSFRARSTAMMTPRGALPPFLKRAVLPPCFLPKPRDASPRDQLRRDPRKSPQPRTEPPPPPRLPVIHRRAIVKRIRVDPPDPFDPRDAVAVSRRRRCAFRSSASLRPAPP